MKATQQSILSLMEGTANKIRSFDPEQEEVDKINQQPDHSYWATIANIFNHNATAKSKSGVEISNGSKESLISLELSSTGPTCGEWFKAREDLHRFLTGETIILRDMFLVTDELLARTDILPYFRPVGVTNRIMVDWKRKMSIRIWEDTDVMMYENSSGPKIPELSIINRSVQPDENTLGENARCPKELIRIASQKGILWTNLYGYSDADSLHFQILNKHLDSNNETVTLFPNDMLTDGRAAYCFWSMTRDRAEYSCNGLAYSNPNVGSRIATPVPFKKTM